MKLGERYAPHVPVSCSYFFVKRSFMPIPAENISSQLLQEEVARIIGLSVMDLLRKKETLSAQAIASQIKSSAQEDVNNTHHVAHYSVRFIMDNLT